LTVPLHLGIAGCGWIAGYVAPFARLNRRIRLLACCDRSPAQAERFANRHHIPHAYVEFEAMLEREALDAVYLAVPHDLHLEMARAAIESGRHVLVEKPIARTLAEGQEIAHLAKESGVRVGVNYQYRYDPGCYALAQAARQGDLGRLYYGRCNLPWQRGADYFQQGSWRSQLARAGGGTLITQGSHLLDLLIWALGGRPHAALGMTASHEFTQADVEDLALGTLEMEGGALVQISSSMIAHPEQAMTIELYGERGTAIYRNRPMPHVRFRGAPVKHARPPVWGIHPLQRSLEAFRAWIADNRPYLTPAEEALPVLAAVEAIYCSAQSGQRERIEFADRRHEQETNPDP
jgi:UDP-N-acetyl-2-amino-2-deoxyglucuronate dehydrogenase